MATELNPLSLNQLNKLAQQHPNPSSTPGLTPGTWMWSSRRATAEDDDSWEVRAFAEDTGNIMGTTWPPRSYTCTFCRREFRSAQALGGHMNVHRRDRARLRQSPPEPDPSSSSPSSPLIFPSHDFVASGGLCLLYPFPSPDAAVFTPALVSSYMDSPSTLLSISPYHHNNLNFPASTSIDTSLYHLGKLESTVPITHNNNNNNNNNGTDNSEKDTTVIEELDLELRLGQSPQPR